MSSQFKFLSHLLSVSLFLFVFSPITFAEPQFSPIVGYWQTIDSKTKRPSSVIQFYARGKLFYGKVVKAYPLPDEQKSSLCVHCKGIQRDKPIIGLIIINNMTCQNDVCHGGTILDPRSGKVYHATMRLVHAGRQLKVRGYLGIALFGKTVVWNRVSKKEAQ